MATQVAASPNLSDVQAAMALCNPGDTLQIPAGNAVWTSGLVTPFPIIIQGAGIDVTNITDSQTNRNNPLIQLTTLPSAGGGTPQPPAGFVGRLTSLTFVGDPTNNGTNFNGIVRIIWTPFRLDHVHFNNTYGESIYCLGLNGVVDHCVHDAFGKQFIQVYGFNYGGQSYGDGSYADDDNLGSSNAVFIEDNQCNQCNFASAVDGYAGARLVFRYNTVTSGFLSVHGTDTSRRNRGTRTFEIYNNTVSFQNTDQNGPRPWGFLARSGTGVVYNNNWTGTGWSFFNGNEGIGASNYRNTTNSEGYPWPPWGPCCQTTPGQTCSVWDGNTDPTTGYPCLDQVGRGKGDLIADTAPNNGIPTNTALGMPAWPRQVLSPVYVWANTLNGTTTVIMAGNTPNFTGGDGRDWINGVQKPGYTPFTYPHPYVQGEGLPTPPPPPTITINPSPAAPVQPVVTTPTNFVTPPAAVSIPHVTTLPILTSCTPAVDCPGSDSPIINTSAEGPDQFVYTGQNWGPYLPPPTDNLYVDQGCLGQCTSTISQQDADLCAARQALFCVNNMQPTSPVPPPVLVCNTVQQATVFCPDGLPFTYTVPAGLFCGSSQTLVNQEAEAYAARLAASQKICLGGLQRCTCINQMYSSQIPVSGAIGAVRWSIIIGSLPPGIMLSQNGTVFGTPTVSGTYNFTIQATTPLGTFMQKAYSIVVLQITTTSLPAFMLNQAYSAALQVTGGSGNYAWNIASGILPAGLTMNQAGVITGIPTSAGTNPVVFNVVDTSCEAAQQSALPPAVTMTTKSTTQIATVLGWSEMPGFVSSPPKKFATVTWTGSSEQQLWFIRSGLDGFLQTSVQNYTGADPNSDGIVPPSQTAANQYCVKSQNPLYQWNTVTRAWSVAADQTIVTQVGGARYDFEGVDEIDGVGNVTARHDKNLSVMCDSSSNLNTLFGAAIQGSNANFASAFTGYFGTNLTQYSNLFGPTELCPSPSLPYVFSDNIASPIPFQDPAVDLVGLWGSVTDSAVFLTGTALITFPSNVLGQSMDNGVSKVQINPYALTEPPGEITVFATLETPIGPIPLPVDWVSGARVFFFNNYSATLSDEYTDAEALDNAFVINGNGNVAQNGQRTTGFTFNQTSVVYTLTCTNLIVGKDYLVSVDFADITAGTVTTNQIGFTASATSKTITASVPTPAANHSVLVRNPQIIFSN